MRRRVYSIEPPFFEGLSPQFRAVTVSRTGRTRRKASLTSVQSVGLVWGKENVEMTVQHPSHQGCRKQNRSSTTELVLDQSHMSSNLKSNNHSGQIQHLGGAIGGFTPQFQPLHAELFCENFEPTVDLNPQPEQTLHTSCLSGLRFCRNFVSNCVCVTFNVLVSFIYRRGWS